MTPSDNHHPDNGSDRLPTPASGAEPVPRSGRVASVHHGRPVPIPSGLKQSFNSMGMLKALRRRWLVALTVGVLCAGGAAAGAWFLLPPTRTTAYTLLQVHSSSPAILFPNVAGSGGSFDIYTRTQSALVRSQLVLNRALSQPDVAKLDVVRNQLNPVEWLASQIQVDFATSPEIMRISLSGEDGDELAKLVNAVREAYLGEIVNKDTERRRDRLRDLTDWCTKYNGLVKRRRADLKALVDQGASINPKAMALQEERALETLRSEQQELLQLQSKLRTLRIELAMRVPSSRDPRLVGLAIVLDVVPGPGAGSIPWSGLARHVLAQTAVPAQPTGQDIPDVVVDAYLRNDAQGAQLLARETRLKQWLKQASGVAVGGENSPALQGYKDQLGEVRTQLVALRDKWRPLIAAQNQDKSTQEEETKRIQLQNQISLTEALEKALKTEMAQVTSTLKDTSRKSFDLESIKEQIAATEKVANRFNDEVEKLSVEVEAPARVRKLQDATVMQPLDAEKQQIRKAAMAGAGAFGAVLFAFGWFEFRKRRIDTPDEVLETLGIKVVGALPALPARGLLGRGRAAGVWNNHLTESINTTRTMLLHAASAEGVHVVLVTSAMAGEGKTSLAGHLAISMARAGKRTLLLDCDLRRSALHELFNLPQEPGVSDLLRDDTLPVQAAIQSTPVSGLALMAAGTWDPGVSEALAQDKLRSIMEPLRQQYDFIIVDSAPVLPVVDTLLVARHVDAVLFSLLRDVSRLPSIFAADQRLAALGIRVLGAVVNGANSGVYGAYSPSYYATTYSR